MESQRQTNLHYKRSRFSTRLPTNRRYTAGHFWLEEHEPNLWRIGFTKFATRFLGEPVEFDFEVQASDALTTGQVIGWVEGFKAVTDLFCPMDGRFDGPNPTLATDIGLIGSDPYGKGWLYRVHGTPGGDCVDTDGYVSILDATIDRMTGKSE